ncbi:rhodanese-like domain-containing protein [Anaeromicrobium sediminis]|uniref:Sulfurtransferase n=1 Tax=Anaeromicrobium sediminis TaxID=1478221 RepID=A0A267MMD4_9FIRM|nr:rhodanese-like domain-containing protein [Anaeromicrobium sediminis]PAB60035.1 sulfurtransferase [Anaeromicrobium sediminis]
MRKKFFKGLSLLLILILSLSFVACSKEEQSSVPAPQENAMVAADAEVNVLEEKVMAYFANMPKDIYKVKHSKAVEEVKNGEDIFILDIRSADDYAKGHLKSAYNAPWGPAIAEALPMIPQDKKVYVYCYTGQTAGQAVMTLNLAGFDAKSINLGWMLGISKVEGYEDVVETTSNELADKVTDIDPEIQEAITAYYNGLADVSGSIFKNYKVSEKSLKELIDNKDESIYVLSVRSAEDFGKMKIATANNIPWGAGMEKEFANLPKDKTIVVYCYTGQTAGQTVAGLRLLGYDAVSLNGGMGMDINKPHGWLNKGYETVK